MGSLRMGTMPVLLVTVDSVTGWRPRIQPTLGKYVLNE